MDVAVMIDYMSDCHDRLHDPGPQSGSFGNQTEAKKHQNCGFLSYPFSTNMWKDRCNQQWLGNHNSTTVNFGLFRPLDGYQTTPIVMIVGITIHELLVICSGHENTPSRSADIAAIL